MEVPAAKAMYSQGSYARQTTDLCLLAGLILFKNFAPNIAGGRSARLTLFPYLVATDSHVLTFDHRRLSESAMLDLSLLTFSLNSPFSLPLGRVTIEARVYGLYTSGIPTLLN